MAQRGHTNIDSMRDESPSSVMNNFIAGLKTEFTGLNFPLNAATDADNVVFGMTGDVTRRLGFDYESSFNTATYNRNYSGISSYRWLNAGGDGESQIYVVQVGNVLNFYLSTAATLNSPLSNQKLTSSIDISQFKVGSPIDFGECQYASGNGYLFVFNTVCDPFFCTFNVETHEIQAFPITVQIRDFVGVPESAAALTTRPSILTPEHNYNLLNQGWTNGALWSTSFTSNDRYQGYPPLSFTGNGDRGLGPQTGYYTWTVEAGLPITAGTQVDISYSVPVYYYSIHDIQWFNGTETGTANGIVISYTGTQLVVNITSVSPFIWGDSFELTISGNPPTAGFSYTVTASGSTNTIATWHSQVGGYPSNSDIWFRFKDTNGNFNPSTTLGNVGINTAPAPKGHFIVDAFNQQQSTVSGISGITPFTTNTRPRSGAWFQGRVWYTGCDAFQQAIGDQNFYTWTENIYFSQVIETVDQFGLCYQTDDPTSQDLYLELPTDGGVITIQGSGAIYKLFPIQNGMLVFAANGIWFITGSQGIGFSATDYTITKISSVRNISTNSYIDVNGLPYFWNEEGIYAVEPAPQGLGLTVNPLTVGTIKTFYNNIPVQSKVYARGDYNPIDYIIQWAWNDGTITDQYAFNNILNYNTFTKAFYTWSLPSDSNSTYPAINDIKFVSNPGGLANVPPAKFKYLTYKAAPGGDVSILTVTFSECSSATYNDWTNAMGTGINYLSYFVTGYSLAGQGLRLWQPNYIEVFSRVLTSNDAYSIQGQWDFANAMDSNKWSTRQNIYLNQPNFKMLKRRHRINGHGLALQIQISSISNHPFDIMGWAEWITENASV